MRRYWTFWLCLSLILGGCLAAPQGKPDKTVKPKRAIPDTKPQREFSDVPSLTVEASDSWLTDLHKFLGDGNTITVEQGWAVTVPGLSITVPAGAKVAYTLSENHGLFKFSDPRPVITVVQYGVKLHPFLNAIEFKSKDAGEATVQEGPFIRKKGFAVAWGYDKSEPPGIVFHEQPGAAQVELPEIWMFSTDNCGHCDAAVKAIGQAKDLPFRLHVVKEVPPFKPPSANGVHAYPTFWWHISDSKPSAKDLANTRTAVGWAGLEHLLKRFNDSRKAQAAVLPAAAPTAGVLFGHHWYERASGRTSAEHLIQDHGLTMEQIRPYLHDQLALCAIHGWKHEGWGVPYSEWRQRYTPRHAVEIEPSPRKDDHASPNDVAEATRTRRKYVEVRVFDLRS